MARRDRRLRSRPYLSVYLGVARRLVLKLRLRLVVRCSMGLRKALRWLILDSLAEVALVGACEVLLGYLFIARVAQSAPASYFLQGFPLRISCRASRLAIVAQACVALSLSAWRVAAV